MWAEKERYYEKTIRRKYDGGGDVGRGDRRGGKGCGGRKQEAKSDARPAPELRDRVLCHVNMVRAF